MSIFLTGKNLKVITSMWVGWVMFGSTTLNLNACPVLI